MTPSPPRSYPANLRFVYDDGADLALLLARAPRGWRGMRMVPAMWNLSQRHTPVADAVITHMWNVPQTWLGTTLRQASTYLHSVLALQS